MPSSGFIHWSACADKVAFPADYNRSVDQEGGETIGFPDTQAPSYATYGRNGDSMAIAAECMSGGPSPDDAHWDDGPTPEQVERICQDMANAVANEGVINDPDHLMTHAEAAFKDGYGVGSGDPQTRWDFLAFTAESIRAWTGTMQDLATHTGNAFRARIEAIVYGRAATAPLAFGCAPSAPHILWQHQDGETFGRTDNYGLDYEAVRKLTGKPVDHVIIQCPVGSTLITAHYPQHPVQIVCKNSGQHIFTAFAYAVDHTLLRTEPLTAMIK